MQSETRHFWRVHCHIGHHPGQWQYWYREQCCAVGWAPPRWKGRKNPDGGWRLEGSYPVERDFTVVQNQLARMAPGDLVVATLPGARVGRIGTIVELQVADELWNPIVAPSANSPFGENGRRILVRWDLSAGPADSSKIVSLPTEAALNSGQLRGTIRRLPLDLYARIRLAMLDESNWVSLAGSFSSERALSDYIAVHPDRLEGGMIAHPSSNVREYTFLDKSRADVILQDRNGLTVVVECKQGFPTLASIKQVEHYRDLIASSQLDDRKVRAMIVHGGARRVSAEVAKVANELEIELVHFDLQVSFSASSAG